MTIHAVNDEHFMLGIVILFIQNELSVLSLRIDHILLILDNPCRTQLG